MIEKIIYDYIKSNTTTPVFFEMPEKPSDKMILIEKTGSSSEGTNLYSAVIAVQTYDTTLYKTAQLNDSVIKLMLNSITIDKVCKCELNSGYYFPDTEKNKYRYQAVFNITFLEE